ncbi:MAG TPA: hypothetical protein VKU90_07100 [Caulobacteraceae bacterium]|jgi:hypothetical protein|nr:hypothetical protein [Caulobacteraceae bacterium]
MKLRSKALAAVGALVVASGVGYGVGVAQAYQPHMQNALVDLQNARSELAVALRDKGGHRAVAVNLVNQAITQVQEGIAAGYYNQ